MKTPVRFYTDGAYSPKRKIGGWACVRLGPSLRETFVRRGSAVDTTNNRMELQAITAALYVGLEMGAGANVIILTDSQYAITVATSKKPVDINADLVGEIRRRIEIIEQWTGSVTLKWIRGHSGIYGNVLADLCACRARDEHVKRLAFKGT